MSMSVSITMDNEVEGDETFTNRIDSVSTSGVQFGDRESIITIEDSTGDTLAVAACEYILHFHIFPQLSVIGFRIFSME